jgi:hypothetical protein
MSANFSKHRVEIDNRARSFRSSYGQLVTWMASVGSTSGTKREKTLLVPEPVDAHSLVACKGQTPP